MATPTISFICLLFIVIIIGVVSATTASTTCPPGQSKNIISGECETCMIGYYCPGNDQSIKCPEGSASPQYGLSQCIKCFNGRTNSNRTFCVDPIVPKDAIEIVNSIDSFPLTGGMYYLTVSFEPFKKNTPQYATRNLQISFKGYPVIATAYTSIGGPEKQFQQSGQSMPTINLPIGWNPHNVSNDPVVIVVFKIIPKDIKYPPPKKVILLFYKCNSYSFLFEGNQFTSPLTRIQNSPGNQLNFITHHEMTRAESIKVTVQTFISEISSPIQSIIYLSDSITSNPNNSNGTSMETGMNPFSFYTIAYSQTYFTFSIEPKIPSYINLNTVTIYSNIKIQYL